MNSPNNNLKDKGIIGPYDATGIIIGSPNNQIKTQLETKSSKNFEDFPLQQYNINTNNINHNDNFTKASNTINKVDFQHTKSPNVNINKETSTSNMNIQSPNEIQTIDSLSKTIEDFKIVELFRSCQEKFDETNKILRDENERLSKSNSDLYTQVSSLYDIDWQKNSKITELTKIISMKDNYISKIHTEINKKIKVWDDS